MTSKSLGTWITTSKNEYNDESEAPSVVGRLLIYNTYLRLL
jgi:hypothetical protein